MINYVNYEVQVEREVDVRGLVWPEPGEAVDDTGLGMNRLYCDLRRLSWREAKRVYEEESKAIARLDGAEDLEAELEAIEQEEFEEADIGLYGLDLGIASTVVALSAARCIPFSSCNAGAYGGDHHEKYPLVAFYGKPQTVPYLLQAAEIAKVGLVGDGGIIFVYASDIRHMMEFANQLFQMRKNFPKAFGTKRKKAEVSKPNKLEDQLELL